MGVDPVILFSAGTQKIICHEIAGRARLTAILCHNSTGNKMTIDEIPLLGGTSIYVDTSAEITSGRNQLSVLTSSRGDSRSMKRAMYLEPIGRALLSLLALSP